MSLFDKNTFSNIILSGGFLPSEGYGDYASAVLSDLQESRLSQIEVLERRVAPAAVVIGLS